VREAPNRKIPALLKMKARKGSSWQPISKLGTRKASRRLIIILMRQKGKSGHKESIR
jgi:hypothetical protein